uniref:hypothetical protein n=1 Tax=Salmonella enterica TaxID=28901 RepID=UPI001C3C852E
DLAPTRGDVDAIARAHGAAERDYKDAIREAAMRHGLKRLPNIKLNTAAIRTATGASVRDQALAAANFDASDMLNAPDDPEDFAPTASATYFNPADLL